MKRVTRTPNRFITYTPSWWVKGVVLFFVLIFLGSCLDENSDIGIKKPVSPFGVYYKEFDIPATTVQTDAIRTSVFTGSDRLLCGVADDLNFGKVTASLFAQFVPPPDFSKIDKTDKTNFAVESVILNYVFATTYYVYGDTSNSQEDFSLHQITDTDFKVGNDYFTTSSIDHELTSIATSSFKYNHDSIVSHRKKNTDAIATNDRYDTLHFTLPLSFGQQLLDTALANGVKIYDKTNSKWVFSKEETDTAFRQVFPGFALIPSVNNTKVFGFKTAVGGLINRNTLITLNYSYVKDGSTVRAKLYYATQLGPAFHKIDYDRSGKAIAGLTEKHTDFNAPDDYCYMQAGTGLYAKLDFNAVHQYFDAVPTDTILNASINSAELIVEIEPDINRHHLSKSSVLFFRVVDNANSFLKAPTVAGANGLVADPAFAGKYYASGSDQFFLDIKNDANDDLLRLRVPTVAGQELLYQGYVSNFLDQFLRIPSGYQKIYSMALLPGDTFYGKSFQGLSFKKNKVKLRVYYTKVL